MSQSNSLNKTLVIGVTASHSTKPINGQVAGYPAKAGIQLIEKTPHRGTSLFFVGCAEAYMFGWIPACAGMTELMGSQL